MMRALLLILALVGLSGCDRETPAERTAAAHKVCRDAGLAAKEGANMLGGLIVYCTNKQEQSE